MYSLCFHSKKQPSQRTVFSYLNLKSIMVYFWSWRFKTKIIQQLELFQFRIYSHISHINVLRSLYGQTNVHNENKLSKRCHSWKCVCNEKVKITVIQCCKPCSNIREVIFVVLINRVFICLTSKNSICRRSDNGISWWYEIKK